MVDSVSTPQRYKKAMEHFITFLRDAEPKPLHEWLTKDHLGLALTATDHDRLFKDKAFAAEKLLETMARWREERLSYPGWLICPHHTRARLRQDMATIFTRKDVLDHLSPTDRAYALFETAWRSEKLFLPVQPYLFDSMLAAFDDDLSGLSSAHRLHLGLILLRLAREEEKQDEFTRIASALHHLGADDTDAQAAVAYQTCLQLLNQIRYSDIRNYVDAINGADPVWKMRQAGIRAEVGEIESATALIVDAAAELRSKQQRDRRSIWVLSRRAWADYLERAVEHRVSSRSGERKWAEWPLYYKAAKCDPWDELESSDRGIEEERREDERDAFDVKPHFDAGTFFEAGGRTRMRSSSAAYEFIRLAEDAGLPFVLDSVQLAAAYARKALPLVFEPTETWYSRLLASVHSHDDELLDRYLNRNAVASLRPEVFDVLLKRVRGAVEYWHARCAIKVGPFNEQRFPLNAIQELRYFVEVLSRLVVRLRPDEAMRTWELGGNLIEDKNLAHWWLHEPVAHLMQRAAEATPPAKRATMTLGALQFPLAIEAGYQGPEYDWPRPLDYLTNCSLQRSGNSAAWSLRVDELIAVVQSGTEKKSRAEASQRLGILDDHKLLTKPERDAFGLALYSRTDSKTGMPVETNFFEFAFLDLPAPTPSLARTYFADTVFKSQISVDEGMLICLKGAAYKPLPDGSTLVPSRADALTILDTTLNWQAPAPDPHDIFGQQKRLKSRIGRELGPMLFFAVAPSLQSDDITNARVEAVIRMIKEVPAPSLAQILPRFVMLRPDLEERATSTIRRLLLSARLDDVSGASAALARWAKQSEQSPVPRSLVDVLLVTVQTIRHGGLTNLLWAARELLAADLLEEKDKDLLVTALSDLYDTTDYGSVDQPAKIRLSPSLVRAQCVKLAEELRDLGVGGEGINLWLDSYTNDPLPEVRFALCESDTQ